MMHLGSRCERPLRLPHSEQSRPAQGPLRAPPALIAHGEFSSLASSGPRRARVFAFPPTERVKPNVIAGASGPLYNWTFLFLQMLLPSSTDCARRESGGEGEGEGWVLICIIFLSISPVASFCI